MWCGEPWCATAWAMSFSVTNSWSFEFPKHFIHLDKYCTSEEETEMRDVPWFAQGHTANQQQSEAQNWSLRIPNPPVLTTRPCYPHVHTMAQVTVIPFTSTTFIQTISTQISCEQINSTMFNSQYKKVLLVLDLGPPQYYSLWEEAPMATCINSHIKQMHSRQLSASCLKQV